MTFHAQGPACTFGTYPSPAVMYLIAPGHYLFTSESCVFHYSIQQMRNLRGLIICALFMGRQLGSTVCSFDRQTCRGCCQNILLQGNKLIIDGLFSIHSRAGMIRPCGRKLLWWSLSLRNFCDYICTHIESVVGDQLVKRSIDYIIPACLNVGSCPSSGPYILLRITSIDESMADSGII